MIEELKLPDYIFSDTKLKNLKRKNFIYGRNGTGKSSISKLLMKSIKKTTMFVYFMVERVLFMKVKVWMQ